jgi:leucyl-tRNA---protein transferase
MNVNPQSVSQRLVDDFLATESLPISEAHDCPYLDGFQAKSEGFSADEIPGGVYRALMDRGFRRSGRVIYRPQCDACRECRQLRVPVAGFAPTRSQRRVLRMNEDITVQIDPDPSPTRDKWEMFVAYVAHQHDDAMPTAYDDFVNFLYRSPTETLEYRYRLRQEVIGVSLVDRCDDALSSVYMYFDPVCRDRSLGTFSVLWEIEHCRQIGLDYYYLGYYVAGSKKMAYKTRFGPHELLNDNHQWRRVPSADTHQ